MNKSDELGTWLKSFFALAYLSFTEIEDSFLELMATCPNEKYSHIFLDYILKTYIEPVEPECPFLQKCGLKNQTRIFGEQFIQYIFLIFLMVYL